MPKSQSGNTTDFVSVLLRRRRAAAFAWNGVGFAKGGGDVWWLEDTVNHPDSGIEHALFEYSQMDKWDCGQSSHEDFLRNEFNGSANFMDPGG